MEYDSNTQDLPRIPDTVGGIQINFCKNPCCLNYGTPASAERQPRGRTKEPREDAYAITGGRSGDDNQSRFLKCCRCGEYPPLKSNLAIHEEVLRLSTYLQPPSEPVCPVEDCPNHNVGISDSDKYHNFGKTKAGSPRFRCRSCGKTFSLKAKPSLRQRKPHKNGQIFQLLVNKVPFSRICEIAGISFQTLYRKIDFIHRQCLLFVGNRERQIPDMGLKRLYLAVDRQDYVVNWTDQMDKRNVVLSAVGTADNRSGYVFGMHLNFDPGMDPSQVIAEVALRGDSNIPAPFRRHARLWIPDDFEKTTRGDFSVHTLSRAGRLFDEIRGTYGQALQRDDIEVFETPDITNRLPNNGLQVHSEYTLYGHFFFLRDLFKNVEKVRFFLDQESGIRAACLSAFVDEVLQKRCDAFYVRINKDLTVNEKRRRRAECIRELEEMRESFPADTDLELELIKIRMQGLIPIGKWQDKWLYHPLPNMSEPDKAVCWLTDLKDRAYDEDHLARLYKMASLHGIDRFFMQVRRRLSLLERPMTSSSNSGRRWYGYSAYNPENVTKLLDIFRVFYNYVELGDDKKTPALRVGLAKGKITIEDILYYH
jgi:transposase-like protein